ncbi:MAG: carbohydrate ABC transporter permease [Ilumatobacter sp.]|uniref:carbohydrate ABC transporter permease n=1 Tax=Ilumatobacter sp. TaxID=1967498 RepID=UPI003297C7FE
MSTADTTAAAAIDDPNVSSTKRITSVRRTAWDEPTGARLAMRYGLLVVITLLVLFPVYTTVLGAFTPSNRVLENRLLPGELTFDVVRNAWTEGRLGRYLANSAVVALVVTLFQLVTSMLSGYAFAHLRFPARNGVFYLFLATLLVPFEATVVVNLDTVQWLGDESSIFGGLNSLQGLAMPFLATAVGTFLVRQALLDLPRDLIDASRLDGLGHLGFIRRVAMPLVRPTLGALALFSFLSTWNQYLWPRLVISDADQHTVQSGLRLLSRSALDEPNLVMAGTVIAALPILVALVLFQRQLVRGLTAGAVKG